MISRFRFWLVALLVAVSCNCPAQIVNGETLVEAKLIANTTAVVPGQPFDVGVLLKMAPDWHTYWEYSGDAGLPTSIKWTLPPGFVAGPIEWPAPEAKLEPGLIQTYAYSDSVLLLTKITPPVGVTGNIALHASVSWLVCKDICVPGDASLDLTLPTAASASPQNAELFEKFRSQVPLNSPPPFSLSWSQNRGNAQLRVEGLGEGEIPRLFPLPDAGKDAPLPKFTPPGTFDLGADGAFRGVLVVGEGSSQRAWNVHQTWPSPAASMGLWMALFYGFLGGILLNLMPCVLPVISLKIFGFIHQAGQSRLKIFSHGVAFTMGVFVWFLGLAAVVVFLKSSGTEVTWAFQFQNPWFNIVIGTLVFVFALNLAGVFELILPGRAATALESTGDVQGLGGSFFQGVFATLLATPCTAPFLGSALGFAFSQSATVIFGMFASVAAGMALPYLLLTAQPGWMRFLPRPGAWMERLKQFMAFPLFATLIWILSIIGGQRGVDGIVWFSAFLLCVALACWIYGAFSNRLPVLFLALILCVGSGWYFLGQKFAQEGQSQKEGISWIPFSKERLQNELESGSSVFVDFTADWCITCKFNERTAINTTPVRTLLAEKKVIPMKADWTNANPEITAALKEFGRVGVPFYVIYRKDQAPIVLPELLTESFLLNALRQLP